MHSLNGLDNDVKDNKYVVLTMFTCIIIPDNESKFLKFSTTIPSSACCVSWIVASHSLLTFSEAVLWNMLQGKVLTLLLVGSVKNPYLHKSFPF